MSQIYIACEEMDFLWSYDQVEKFKSLWKDGADITKISDVFERDPDEVALLIIGLARSNEIVPRKGGLMIDWQKKRGKKPRSQKKVDVEKLHQLYMDQRKTMDQIAGYFDSSRRRLHAIIERERAKNPDKWPPRHPRKQ